MKADKLNRMNHRVSFYEESSDGPEVGGDLVEVYQCYCDVYEPTTRDATAFDTQTSTTQATLTIRNQPKAFRPQAYHKFKVVNGFFEGLMFDINRITPYDDNPQYLKIVGSIKEG